MKSAARETDGGSGERCQEPAFIDGKKEGNEDNVGEGRQASCGSALLM